MTQTRALPIQNNNTPPTPMPTSPCSLDSMTKRPNSPSRFKRSIKGVRNFFRHFDPDKEFNESNIMSSINVNNSSVNSSNNDRQLQSDNNSYESTHQRIAMTLSEDVHIPDQDDNNIDFIETKSHYPQHIQFLPIHQHQYHYNHNSNNNISHSSSNNINTIKAYVHYEPGRKLVALGNNPNTKHTKTVWLTLEQFAWIIRQLHHEQYIYGLLRNMSSNNSPLSLPTTATSWSTSSSYSQQKHHYQQAAKDPQITAFIGIILNNNDINNKINSSDNREQIIQNNKNHRNSIQSTQTFNTITRRLSRLMQRAKLNRYQNHHRTLLLLPKSLLLHAAFYIPMTKPLPPLLHPTTSTTKNDHYQQQQQQLESSFHSIPNTLSDRLYRYVQLAALCMHDLSLDDSSGSLLCRKCFYSNPVIRQLKSIIPTNTHSVISSSSILSPTTTTTKQNQHQPVIQLTSMTSTRNNDATFPITYLHTSIEQRRRTFDSHYSSSSIISPNNTIPSLSSTNIISLNSKRTTHYSQQPIQEEQQQKQHRPRACSAIITDSVIDPLFDSSLLDSVMGKRGYVAMDDENQEIIVTFPGIPASGLLFENTSFTPVPWRESLDSNQRQGQKYYQQEQEGHLRDNDINDEDEPYVLECAVAAWRRCELTVATSLMRICRIAPEDYRVVIIGHSLGGAVAALCASSLVTTGLLVDRSVTLCTIDSPRVGSASFVEHLAEQIETIRITHVSDIWSQMPPRTSGLLHVGSTTITVSNNNSQYAEDQGEQEKKEETINNDNIDSDQIIHDTATTIRTIKDEDVCMLQANDSIWIENYLAETFPSSISTHSSNSSIWGISLYSTPCQQQSQLTHYDEKHLCIV
ncbi:hypothetical protein BDC45DRAFT_557485 [Circinella umbellata]|nr:hypothetical protein BDC45DRAFT_557485 [Circinella umbellata]